MTAIEFIKHMNKINGSPTWTEDETSLAIALDEYARHVWETALSSSKMVCTECARVVDLRWKCDCGSSRVIISK